jgi:hypothetical protein
MYAYPYLYIRNERPSRPVLGDHFGASFAGTASRPGRLATCFAVRSEDYPKVRHAYFEAFNSFLLPAVFYD